MTPFSAVFVVMKRLKSSSAPQRLRGEAVLQTSPRGTQKRPPPVQPGGGPEGNPACEAGGRSCMVGMGRRSPHGLAASILHDCHERVRRGAVGGPDRPARVVPGGRIRDLVAGRVGRPCSSTAPGTAVPAAAAVYASARRFYPAARNPLKPGRAPRRTFAAASSRHTPQRTRQSSAPGGHPRRLRRIRLS